MIHVERVLPRTDKLNRLEVMDDEQVIGNVTCVKGEWTARVKWASTDEKALELPGGPGGMVQAGAHLVEGAGILPQAETFKSDDDDEPPQAVIDLVVMMHAYWAEDAYPDDEPRVAPPKDPPNAADEGWAMWPEDEN